MYENSWGMIQIIEHSINIFHLHSYFSSTLFVQLVSLEHVFYGENAGTSGCNTRVNFSWDCLLNNITLIIEIVLQIAEKFYRHSVYICGVICLYAYSNVYCDLLRLSIVHTSIKTQKNTEFVSYTLVSYTLSKTLSTQPYIGWYLRLSGLSLALVFFSN